MLKDNSYGIVPLTYRQNFWEVFVVLHLNGGHWGFPKGHADREESTKEAAERELFEETGMRIIRYLSAPYLTEQYQHQKGGQLIDKTVRYYLAEVTPKYTLQAGEIIEGKWVLPQDLDDYATFPDQKTLYHAVVQQLKN